MLQPPETVRSISRTLEAAGHQAWCVGGAVRDALLGIETLDWDIATSARPEQVQELFRRTVPVGLKYGTVGVLDRHGTLHEVTTFRHDVETDGRHAVVKFGASLDEDLARRDFTINAIAVHAETLELRDPFEGRTDLERRIVRCVGDAQERLREDRLRALRALRFAGRFEFSLDPATWQAIRDSAAHLGRLSMERVKQELEKVMEQVARPSVTLERYREAGIFAALVPALADAPKARFAAIDHLARPGLLRRPHRRMLRLAALFIEPGVPAPRALEQTLKDLKFSNVEVRTAMSLATVAADCGWTVQAPGPAFAASEPPSRWAPLLALDDAALRRMLARVGRLTVPGLARILWARANAEGATVADGRAGVALYRGALRSAFRDPLAVGDLAIDGEDLRQAGVPAGKPMGDMLKHLLDVVLDAPAHNTREVLLAEVRARTGGAA
jgi:tRNA nucleotidyltransferase (CCA-adding enzyme)